MKIKVEVSARHIHLTQKDIDILFGKGYELKKLRNLSQANDFAAEEKVILKTEKGELSLRIVGPKRNYSQIELSLTDVIRLEIEAPLRLSGDINDAPKVVILGPEGKAEIAAIIAKRHLHVSPEEARQFNLKDGQGYNVLVEGERRLIFHNVIARVKEGYHFICHFDADEANACGLGKTCGEGELLI